MKIVTAVVNNPVFIEIQHAALKEHFKGEYEFIVFNDAKAFPDSTNEGNPRIRDIIIDTCSRLNIRCIPIPNDHHRTSRDYSKRAADSMNFIARYQRENPDKYLLLDSDMFPVVDFNVDKYSNYTSAVVPQERGGVTYIWNGLYYFDVPSMKRHDAIDWNVSPGCDTGGMMCEWLSLQPPTDVYSIRHLWSCSWSESDIPAPLNDNKSLVAFLRSDPRNQNGKFFCELYDGIFLHYRAGGNWRGEGLRLHSHLSQQLKNALSSTTTYAFQP